MSLTTSARRRADPPIEWRLVIYARSRWTPPAVGALAGLLSLVGAWVPSFWSDEAATVRAASLSPIELAEFVQHKDAVHAVYYLIIGLWTRLAGSSELTLRAPSAVAVAVAATGLVCIFRHFKLPGVGVTAGIIFAVLPRTTYMGAEARSYALATAFCVVMALFTVRVLQNSRKRDAVALAFLTAAGTAIFVYSVFVAAALVFYAALQVVLRPRERPRAISSRPAAVAITAILLGAGATAPLALIIIGQKSQIAWLGSQPVVNAWTVLAEPWAESSGVVAALSLVLLVIAAVRWRTVTRSVGASLGLLLLIWMLVPGGLLLAFNAIDGPLYTSRYLSFTAPAVAGAVAVALHFAMNRRLGGVALALLVLAAAPTYVAQRTVGAKGGADLRPVADYIASRAARGDGIVFEKANTAALDPRQALAAYPSQFADLHDLAVTKRFPATGTFADTTMPLDQTVLDHAPSRIWMITPTTSHCADTDDASALHRANFRKVSDRVLGRDRVCEFQRSNDG